MTQRSLFEGSARAANERRNEALTEIVPHAGRLRRHVLALIEAAGEAGLTCDEIEKASGLPHQSASARVHELMRAEAIRAAGKRKTRSGRNATVWVST